LLSIEKNNESFFNMMTNIAMLSAAKKPGAAKFNRNAPIDDSDTWSNTGSVSPYSTEVTRSPKTIPKFTAVP
jgi:hypothetical protein